MKISSRTPAAFTLIEVTLALSVSVFCMLSVFGLLPIGLSSNQNAFEQTAAAGIATAVSADFHGTPLAGGTSSRFGFAIPTANGTSVQTLFFSQDGSPTGAVGGDAATSPVLSRYRATVTCKAEDTTGTLARNKLFKVWIMVTWPALADPKAATPPSNFAGSFEAVTSLNCN